jgi:ABC-2 type transport system permease protein
MYALWCVVVKEFLQLRQDRRMIPALVVGPLFQLIALGYAANMDVVDVPLLVVDQDRSAASRALVARFEGSGYFGVVGAVATAEQVEPWLVSGAAHLALVIDAGYGRDLARHGRPRVQIIADGSDANSSVVGLGYAARIVGAVGAELVQAESARRQRARLAADAARTPTGAPSLASRPLATPGSQGRSELLPRVLYNPDLRSRWFYVPAVVAMVLMLVTMIMPSMAIVREKEVGTLEQLIVTPLRPWQLVVGKLLPFVVLGMLDLFLITGLARAVFGVPLRGSLTLLAGLTLLFLMTTLGLGMLTSTLVRTQQQAMMFAVFILMVPMIYLSGLVFPIDNMPHVIQVAALGIPVRYYAIVLRGVFLKGVGLDVLWPEALALLGIGAGLLVVASLRFRKSLD